LKSTLIAGSGGQGILLLGKLFAQSVMLAGKNVTWFPSYGAEIRGGTANCTVIVSDEMIGSPIVSNPDMLVVLNEESKTRFEGRIRHGGTMIMNSSAIKSEPEREDIRVLRIPASEIADSLGNKKSANMVMLGALLAQNPSFSLDTSLKVLEQAMAEKKKDDVEKNKKAIIKGKSYCEGEEGQSS
jgi:2-oxoglutarate ferredoxin oxidoreductase subunit gamma